MLEIMWYCAGMPSDTYSSPGACLSISFWILASDRQCYDSFDKKKKSNWAFFFLNVINSPVLLHKSVFGFLLRLKFNTVWTVKNISEFCIWLFFQYLPYRHHIQFISIQFLFV